MEEWRLTKEEEARVIAAGKGMSAAQAAKKWAYREAGRTILNPDALDDLYEALRAAQAYIARKEMYSGVQDRTGLEVKIIKALSKAEGLQVEDKDV